MPQVTRLRVAAAAIAAGALTLGTLVSATAAQAANPRRAIADSHPTWAVAAKRLSSKAVTSGTVNARVYLAPSHQAELAGDVAAVSSPASKSYRHFWTTAAVRKEFAPSAAEVASVKSWLTSAGLSVTKTDAKYPAGAYVGVRGSVAAASKAFGVTFGTYRGPGGQSARAPEQAATAPSSVASSVLAVSGLDTAKSQIKPQLPPPPPNYWVAKPCSTYYGQKTATNKPKAYGKLQPWTNCGYTPSQIARRLRGDRVRDDGQGPDRRDRGRLRLADHAQADANQFRDGHERFNQPDARPSSSSTRPARTRWPGRTSVTRRAGTARRPSTWSPCTARRPTPTSGTSARAAARTPTWPTPWRLIVDERPGQHRQQLLGRAGQYSTTDATYDLIFQFGALEGIGFMFSSGDSGYEGPGEDPISPSDQVDYPTSSPYVTSVGGTSLAISKTNSYQWETSWGTVLDPLIHLKNGGKKWQYTPPGKYPSGYDGSGGGGVSTEYTQPGYQAGVVPDQPGRLAA